MTAPAAESITGTYTIDPTHSRVGFSARHAMVAKVRGSFKEFEGSGYFDATDPTNSNLDITIAAVSIDTRNEDRDAHLRSNDFFAMDDHPTITFQSTDIVPTGVDQFAVTGDLTIKGVTKPVTVDVEFTGSSQDPWGNTRVGLDGSVVINRKDWGVSFNAPLETGGVLIGEKVALEIELSLVKVR